MKIEQWISHIVHTPMHALPVVYRKHKKHMKIAFLHSDVMLMGIDAFGAWALIALGPHEMHLCGATGATLAGIACFFE